MSVQSNIKDSDTPKAFCAYCNEPRDLDASVKGSYCSRACWYRSKGADTIRQINSQHDWCSTCFRPLKDVISRKEYQEWRRQAMNTPEDLPDNFIGTQHTTETTVLGVTDEYQYDEHPNPSKFGRWACECGSVNPSTREEAIREANTQTVISSLFSCMVRLERKGAIDSKPNKDAYFDALEEHWKDWEYAIGRAIE